MDLLNQAGINMYTKFMEFRGKTDYYTDQALADAKSIMESIESKLSNLEDDFKFGYKKSEALVCMKRCPNNTFPIFGVGKNKAPYERR